MSKPKFTPGPWMACWTQGALQIVTEADNYFVIANILDDQNDIEGEAHASQVEANKNADLIAAALKMYRILKETYVAHKCQGVLKPHDMKKIADILAEIDGES